VPPAGPPYGASAAAQQQPPAREASPWGLHLSMATLVASAVWFFRFHDSWQGQPSLNRKLLLVVLGPLLWAYVSAVAGGPARRGVRSSAIHAAAWFLTGFVAAHKLANAKCGAAG
jgi:hypothetical protein